MAASLRTLPALCSLLLTPALLEATRLAYALAWWQRRWARPIVASATCSAWCFLHNPSLPLPAVMPRRDVPQSTEGRRRLVQHTRQHYGQAWPRPEALEPPPRHDCGLAKHRAPRRKAWRG